MPDTFPPGSEKVLADNPEDTLTWELWSLTGDEDPAWPAWAACAGRHTIRIPKARIRNIRRNSPFIEVHYAENLNKYNLIAAATYQVKNRGSLKRNAQWFPARQED
jgi:hypothetical protein